MVSDNRIVSRLTKTITKQLTRGSANVDFMNQKKIEKRFTIHIFQTKVSFSVCCVPLSMDIE